MRAKARRKARSSSSVGRKSSSRRPSKSARLGLAAWKGTRTRCQNEFAVRAHSFTSASHALQLCLDLRPRCSESRARTSAKMAVRAPVQIVKAKCSEALRSHGEVEHGDLKPWQGSCNEPEDSIFPQRKFIMQATTTPLNIRATGLTFPPPLKPARPHVDIKFGHTPEEHAVLQGRDKIAVWQWW